MGFGRQLDLSEDEYMHHAFCSRHLPWDAKCSSSCSKTLYI